MDFESTIQEAINKSIRNVKTQTGLTVFQCIEKQMVKKPILFSKKQMNIGQCSVCKNNVLSHQNYCERCGQRLREVVK